MRSRVRRLINSLVAAPLDWAFRRRFLARALSREHVLCLGDSHVRILSRVSLPGVWFRAKPLGGATASGVLNPNSQTQSLSTFMAELQAAKPWHQVLFQLGEVDCGFVIWHRAQRHGIGIEEQLEQTLDTYTAFLASVAEMGFRRVIVLSPPLPTISDYPSQFAEVAGLRKEVTASMADRTRLTLSFNEALRDRCADIDAVFVDATTGHLDRQTGLIDRRFLPIIDEDHHLAEKAYAALISRQLRWLGR